MYGNVISKLTHINTSKIKIFDSVTKQSIAGSGKRCAALHYEELGSHVCASEGLKQLRQLGSLKDRNSKNDTPKFELVGTWAESFEHHFYTVQLQLFASWLSTWLRVVLGGDGARVECAIVPRGWQWPMDGKTVSDRAYTCFRPPDTRSQS